MKKRIFIYSKKELHLQNILLLFEVDTLDKGKLITDLYDIKMVSKIDNHLPWDYDAYILHASDTKIEQIEKLREIRPNAFICGLTNPGITTNRIYGIVDRTFKDCMDETDFKYFLMDLYKK